MKYTLASIACLVLLLLVFLYTDPYLNDPRRKDDPYLSDLRGRADYERNLAQRNFAIRMQKNNDYIDSSFTKEDDVQLTAVPDYVRRVLMLAR